LVSLKARNKAITIAEAFEPDMPELWADPRAVRQVALNLLSNAIKFTQPGGHVEVKVGWTAGGGQYVCVRDNGPGIAEEEMPVVLSAFGQGAIAIKSAEQGTGLGLPIVQALMDTHDGSFVLQSRLAEGTEAVAAFPRARVMEGLPPSQGGRRRRRSAGWASRRPSPPQWKSRLLSSGCAVWRNGRSGACGSSRSLSPSRASS